MGEILGAVTAFLDELQVDHEPVEGRGDVVTFAFEGDNERWRCFVEAREAERHLLVYSVSPFNIPVERRVAAAELVARANYGLVVGSFDLDLDDGEVRMRTFLDLDGAPADPGLVQQLITNNLRTMNRYSAAIAAVVTGEATPMELAAKAEA